MTTTIHFVLLVGWTCMLTVGQYRFAFKNSGRATQSSLVSINYASEKKEAICYQTGKPEACLNDFNIL